MTAVTGFVATSIAPEDLPGGRSALCPVDDQLDGADVVKVIVMGSPRSVENTIRVLYLRGFAELYEWSPFQPAPTPGEVMSLMRRRLVLA